MVLNNTNNSIYGDTSNIYFNVSGGAVSHKLNVTDKTVATINSTGVGIRTTAPLWDLDVSGNGRVTGNLFLDTSSNNYIYSDFSNVYFNVSGGRHKFNVSGVAGGRTVATINSTGVGIGVINPGYSLDVSGTSKFVSPIIKGIYPPAPTVFIGEGGVDTGSYGTLSITRPNDSSGAHFSLIRSGNNTTQMGIFNTNSLGIWNGALYNTPNPGITLTSAAGTNISQKLGINIGNPSCELDVSGNARFAKNILINAGSTDNNLYFLSDSTTNTSGNIVSRIFTTGNNLFFDYYTNITFRYASNLGNNTGYAGTQIFFTNIGGSASIGIGVYSPSYNLDVSGTGKFTNSITITSANPTYFYYCGSPNYISCDQSTTTYVSANSAHIFTSYNKASGGGSVSIGTGQLPNYNLDVSGNIYTSKNIYSFGNIGIGTTTPSYTLDVTGTARFTGNLTAGSISTTGANGISTDNIFSMYYGTSGSRFRLYLGNGATNYAVIFYSTSGLCFEPAQALPTINLGDSNNNTAVNVKGTLYLSDIQSINYTYYSRIGFGTSIFTGAGFDNTTHSTHFYTPNYFYWYYCNSGFYTTSWCMKLLNGDLNLKGSVTATMFTPTSDYRIKENIVNLKETNYTVDNLRPIHYYNKNTKRDDIGFIAHEVQEEFPFLVYGEKDGKENQSLNYTGLIGVLVKEIQELKESNRILQETVNKHELFIQNIQEKFSNIIFYP